MAAVAAAAPIAKVAGGAVAKAAGGSMGMSLIGDVNMKGATQGLGQVKGMMGQFGDATKKASGKLGGLAKKFTATSLAAGAAGVSAGAFFKRFTGGGIAGAFDAAIARIKDIRDRINEVRELPLKKAILDWNLALLELTKSETWGSFKDTLISIKVWFIELGIYLLETLGPIFAKVWSFIEPVLPQLKIIGIILVAIGALIIGFILAPFVLIAGVIVGIAWLLKGVWELATWLAEVTAGPLIAAWEAVTGWIKKAWDWLVGMGKAIWNFLKDLKALPGKAWDALAGIFDALKDPFVRAFTWLWDAITGLPGKAWSALAGLYDAVVDPFRRAFNWVKDKIKSIPGFSTAVKIYGKVKGYLSDFIVQPGKAPVAFSPQDTVIGANSIEGLTMAVNSLTGGSGNSKGNLNVNITVNGSMNRNDIDYMAQRVSSAVESSWHDRRAI